jgi:hypothetical protein
MSDRTQFTLCYPLPAEFAGKEKFHSLFPQLFLGKIMMILLFIKLIPDVFLSQHYAVYESYCQ